MKAFGWISFLAAIITGIVVVSCSPLPESYSKDALSGQAPTPGALTSVHAPMSANTAANLNGDWVCSSGASGNDSCSYALISISAKDGTAQLQDNSEDDSARDAKISVMSFSDHLHLEMSFTGTSGLLSGDISLNQSRNELVIDGEHYARK
jgi:hypothetical protein